MIYKVEVEPLHDYVVVRTIDNPEKTTPGGIIIPDTAEKQPLAQIVALGPGREGIPASDPRHDLAPGDIVLLQKFIGTKVDVNGKICMLVKYLDVQAKIKYSDPETGKEFKPVIPEDYFNTETGKTLTSVLTSS